MSPSLWLRPEPLLLASASPTRRALLEQAGLPVEARPANIDERAIEAAHRAAGDTADAIASALALAKARAVAALSPGRIVIGADQTLACDDDLLHKPADRAAAEVQLQRLSGRRHLLHAGLAVFSGDTLRFSALSSAAMTMRPLSRPMIARYLDCAGEDVTATVGAYRLEGLGMHLFERVEGDYFTILGLPMLALLAGLRREGWIAA